MIPYIQTIKFHIPLPDWMPIDKITLPGFGMCVATGVFLGTMIAVRCIRKLRLDEKVVYDAMLYLMFGVIVGGHVGYGLFYHPGEYFANPIKFLNVWKGLSSFGGFLVAIPLLFYLFHKRKVPIWAYADTIAYSFTLGWFFGRMGCTINHEHPGSPTRFPLGRFCRPVEGNTIEFPSWMTIENIKDLRFSHCIEAGAPRVTSYSDVVPVDYQGVVGVHDMGFYEALMALGMFFLFMFLRRKPRFGGFYVLALGTIYAPVRFGLDFLRPETGNVRYMGLTLAQWGCIALLGLCAWGYTKLSKNPLQPTVAEDPPPTPPKPKKRKPKKGRGR
jgi:phosphatidylglycerol:prolipoprotein diacylglycerol transferase